MRAIRLKEFPPATTLHNTPPDWYDISRDASLAQKSYRIETDEFGFIKSHDGAGCGNRVIFLGDSFVEGMFLDPEHRFCSILEARLRRAHHVEASVLNGGYSGATTLHSLNVSINKIIPLSPLAVILMTGIVDVDVALKQASFWSRDCGLEPIVDTQTENTSRDHNDRPCHDFADRKRMLAIFATAAGQFGIPLWFATFPHRQVNRGAYVSKAFPDRAAFDSEVRLRRRANDVTRRFAIREKMKLFDVEIELLDRDDIFYDMYHLNSSGGAVVADCLVRLGIADALRTSLQKVS
jgi:hypothetical protein